MFAAWSATCLGKTACNHHSIHRLLRSVRLFLDHLQQICLGTPVHAIDFIVHFAHLVGKTRIAFEQRQDRRPDHAPRHLSHGGEIHGQFDLVGLQNVARAFRDPIRLIANPLQVAIDLDDRKDEAKIDRHGLFFREQFIGHLIQFTLGGVDGGFILLYIVAQGQVPENVGVDRGLNRLLRKGGHRKKLVLEFGELKLKVNARHSLFFS